MTDGRYFVRTSSKILGPFGSAQLESLQTRGRLKPDHEISSDRKSWKPVSEFFADTNGSSALSSDSFSQTDDEWYYADEGQRVGPMSHEGILEKVRRGVLHQNDLVWKEGFQDWQPVRNVPELDLGESPVPSLIQPAIPTAHFQRMCLKCGTQDPIGGDFCPRCGNRYGEQSNYVVNGQSAVAADHKDRIVAALLALFLGGLGIHHFYLGNTVLGVIYLLFCWTFIPAIISFIEGIIFLCTSGPAFDAQYNLHQKA